MPYEKKIDTRVKSLLIPYIFWNIFWLGYNLLKSRVVSSDIADVLNIDSVEDVIACFWMKGFGSHPEYPIAGYMWFIRDLMIFAVLSPLYNYFYQKATISLSILFALLVSESVVGWQIPGLNVWIYVGGFIAAKGYSIEQVLGKYQWRICLSLFVLGNIIYYCAPNERFATVILSIVSIPTVLKLVYCVNDSKTLLSLSAASTWIYVTHIFVLNVSRHTIVKFLIVDSDFMMCMYYLMNASFCVVVCLSTYYILKRFKCKRLLLITTGGRG